jgi:dipeptidyl aminopeptidase/acylaminoacyl peptidase
MSILHRSLPLGLVVTLLFAPAARAAKKPEVPPQVDALINVLFSAPEFERAKLSPDGAYLAFLKEEDGVKILKTYAFKTKHTYQMAGASGVNHREGSGLDQNIANFAWLGADQLLIYANEGDVYYSGLWVANANLKQCEKLVLHDRLLFLEDALPQNPTTALLHESSRESFYGPLWYLDKKSLKTYEAESNPGRVFQWQTDTAGVVRLAVVSEPNSNWSYLFRENEKASWRPLRLPSKSTVITFDVAGKNLLVTKPGEGGRDQLLTFDLNKQELDPQGVADSVYDVGPSVIRDAHSGAPVDLIYEGDKPTHIWLSSQHAALSRVIEGVFPGQFVTAIQVLDDGDTMFGVYSDTSPLAYFRYNVAKQDIRPIIFSRPEAAKMKWAPMTPIAFTARDGYRLHGYLTLPLGRTANQKVPLVVLSHGGPQDRDTWGFDAEVQFLAALGYGVLQVNYRGSTGFGLAHQMPNAIEVAEKSVDDVADGVRWTIDQGYANPKKIVAYGASYGGYISLALATRYPDLPTAVVGFAGVYDWEALYKEDTNHWLGSNVPSEVFRWRSDYYLDVRKYADRYRALSPVNFAKQINCPVLLFHGSLDQTVNPVQTKAMAKALADAGKSVEVLKDSDAIHGLTSEKQNKAFYRGLAAFLLKNVPTDPR